MIDDATQVAIGTTVATASAVAEFFVPGTVLPFFGVTITTLGMASAGSMIAFAYGTPVSSRKRLYGYAIGGVFIGVWSVQILPGWLGWHWYIPAMEPPIAGFVALFSRWVIPFIVEHLPSIWSRVFNTGRKSGD